MCAEYWPIGLLPVAYRLLPCFLPVPLPWARARAPAPTHVLCPLRPQATLRSLTALQVRPYVVPYGHHRLDIRTDRIGMGYAGYGWVTLGRADLPHLLCVINYTQGCHYH